MSGHGQQATCTDTYTQTEIAKEKLKQTDKLAHATIARRFANLNAGQPTLKQSMKSYLKLIKLISFQNNQNLYDRQDRHEIA